MHETIVALATPPGHGGLGVIRLSGPQAVELVDHFLLQDADDLQPNRASLRKLIDPVTKQALDHAVVLYFKSPNSYTGEDVVELSCHGSPVLLRHIIDGLLRLGARLAGPGEFTLRALASRRLNLTQAEAIRDLINAQTNGAMQQAARQLGGELSTFLKSFESSLVEVVVDLESSIEFVEDDLPEIAIKQYIANLEKLRSELSVLAGTYSTGRHLRDGFKITLAGRPNVGKSSLFNRLVVLDRAIVSEIPGTTRDSLSERISVEGIPVLLTDTAGLRSADDVVESLGVDRTKRAIADADLVVVVLDGSAALVDEDYEVLGQVAEKPFIVAVNKCDLESSSSAKLEFPKLCVEPLRLSAKTGLGFDALHNALIDHLGSNGKNDSGLLVTDARHYDLLQRTLSALESSIALMKADANEELVIVGLYDALRYLGEITGETTPDDILSRIFATFCIGK